jgi:hypothetical protein
VIGDLPNSIAYSALKERQITIAYSAISDYQMALLIQQ